MKLAETEPVFAAPWEARAFAIAVRLHERGLFTWAEWSEALGAAKAEAPDDGGEAWLTALERMLARHGLVSGDELAAMRAAWREAARRTPHGLPIEIDPELR